MLSVSDWRMRRLLEAPRARRTDVCARRAGAARHQQVGDICAGDQQHQAADDKQDAQAIFVVLFHR